MPKSFKTELAEIQRGFAVLTKREMHPLKVYRPTQWQLPIHESTSEELLISGGKRSGKTLAATMTVGSRILGIPITRQDGTKIKNHFRKASRNNPQLYWVVGLNVDHIGQTIFPRLFLPGLGCNFRVIEDLETKQWRAFNENSDTDKDRYEESVICPPMIGEDLIVEGSWHMESRAGNIFKSVRLKNGATICAYPSTGDRPKMGDAVHGIWIDEDIANPLFIKEWQDRLITANGWLIWSVWPQMANFALLDAIDRAKEAEDEPDPPIQMFRLEGSKNPYNSERGIQRGLGRMDDDDDMAHRDRGDIEGLLGTVQMYDFGTAIHILRPKEYERPQNAFELLENLLRKYGRLPDEWTRYLGIDPSNTRTAALVGVVPPEEWQGINTSHLLIIEDELVVKRHNPGMFADAVSNKGWGLRRFEAYVMDQQIGRQTTVGSDTNVFTSYANQFAQRGMASRLTKHSFFMGCPNKQKRRRTVRDLLEPTNNGIPSLLVVESKTIELQREFKRYRKKQTKIGDKLEIMDDPVNERTMDCMQALEYLCQYVAERFEEGTAYVDPLSHRGGTQGSAIYKAAMNIRKQDESGPSGGYVHFGPGAYA